LVSVFDRTGASLDFKQKRIQIPQHLVKESPRKLLARSHPAKEIGNTASCWRIGGPVLVGGTPVPYVRDVKMDESV
jgi:hypothetical protein